MRPCRAPPSPPPPPLLLLLLLAGAGAAAAVSADADDPPVTINRHHRGDMFVAGDEEDACARVAACGSASGGTAARAEGADCACQCLPHLPVFRDDLHVCIDDIHECPLAPFEGGGATQRIPFVFLPLEGQIVHPSAEISFGGGAGGGGAPVCVVAGAQFLTPSGWTELRAGHYTEPPFRLFRDEGRTFLQWLGAVELRLRMEGRLILVRLLCKDVGGGGGGADDSAAAAAPPREQAQLFSPCVAFRVAGSPRDVVAEVSFPAGGAGGAAGARAGLSLSEYVAIGVCSLLLGLVYVASVFLYLHVRRRRRGSDCDSEKAARKAQLATAHVHGAAGPGPAPGGAALADGTGGGGGFLSGLLNACGRGGRGGGGGGEGGGGGALSFEEGVVKSNPLLQARRLSAAGLAGVGAAPTGPRDALAAAAASVVDGASYASDSASCCSDGDAASDALPLSDDSASGQSLQVTAALVHRCLGAGLGAGADASQLLMLAAEVGGGGGLERLPEENVSIVETPDGRSPPPEQPALGHALGAAVEAAVGAAAGARRKLYFNPAFFEPELLAAPPPAAIEFLTKIREVMAIAKHKLSAKRFAPSLMGIPEEDGASAASRASGASSTSASACAAPPCPGPDACGSASLRRDAGRRPRGAELLPVCRACCPAAALSAAAAESKASSIRRWLEGVPVGPLPLAPSPVPAPGAAPGAAHAHAARLRPPPSLGPKRSSPSPAPAADATGGRGSHRSGKAAAPPPPAPASPPLAPQPPRPPPQPPAATPPSPAPPPAPSLAPGAGKGPAAPPGAKRLMDAVIRELEGHKQPPRASPAKGAAARAPAPRVALSRANSLAAPLLNESSSAETSDPPSGGDYEADSLERSAAAAAAAAATAAKGGSNEEEGDEEEENVRTEDACEEDECEGEGARGLATPSDYGDCAPEQRSPSPLGGALPLEEELTARNEIFNVRTGATTISKMKGPTSPKSGPSQDDHEYEIIVLNPEGADGDAEGDAASGGEAPDLKLLSLPQLLNSDGYSLVSEVYVNDDYNFGSAPGSPSASSSASASADAGRPKIRYAEPDKKPGHLTIQVEDSPDNYRHLTDDSDSFEPDTLDRKPSRRKWQSKSIVIEEPGTSIPCEAARDEAFTDSLERPRILLRTNGSFRKDEATAGDTDPGPLGALAAAPLARGFGSLREIFEARARAPLPGLPTPAAAPAVAAPTSPTFDGEAPRRRTLSWKRSARQAKAPVVVPAPAPTPAPDYDYDECDADGVLLHPDLRQARRQRRPTPPSAETKPLPFRCAHDGDDQGLYEAPPPPRPLHEPTPPLPPRNSRPPLPPKNGASPPPPSAADPQRTACAAGSAPARRLLPALPPGGGTGGGGGRGGGGLRARTCSHDRSPTTPDPETASLLSAASADSLNSSDYEAFYAAPFSTEGEDGGSSTLGARVERSLGRLTSSSPTSTPAPANALVSPPKPPLVKGDERRNPPTLPKGPSAGPASTAQRRRTAGAGPKPEDSGYLSTDSNDSKRAASVSETDGDSLYDGASESGGESIATDSFFFGSCRKAMACDLVSGGGCASDGVGVGKPQLLLPLLGHDDAADNSSDSETVSFVTVTTNSRCGTVR